MTDSKGSKRKEEHIESKTKSCPSRRKTSEMKRIYQEFADKLDIKLEQFMEEEIDAGLKKIFNRKVTGLDKIPTEI